MNLENIENLKNLNLLYVEDDEVIQKLFSDILKKVFAHVSIASNGQEGLDLFKKNEYNYDVVVSDIKMPELNGLDMIEEIKKINPEMPCILTTAHGEFDYFMKANEIGVYRYIQKPLDVNELFEAIVDFQSGLEVKKIDL
ncbi:MAG: response regulator [Arcobacteraceae bacterium]